MNWQASAVHRYLGVEFAKAGEFVLDRGELRKVTSNEWIDGTNYLTLDTGEILPSLALVYPEVGKSYMYNGKTIVWDYQRYY